MKAILVSEEKLNLACKVKTVPFSIDGLQLTCTHTIFAESYNIHVDLKTFNETISNLTTCPAATKKSCTQTSAVR